MPREKTPDIERLVWPKDGDRLAWLDRAPAIMNLIARAGTMYLGYQAFEKVTPGSGLAGAIVSQIAMRLATADNVVSGGAGVATLTGMGILNVMTPDFNYSMSVWDWIRGLLPVKTAEESAAEYQELLKRPPPIQP